MNETDTLRGLIAKARRERDMSVRKLAQTAQDAGHKIVGTTLNAIEAGTYHSVPTAETIRTIGWLAKVPDEIAFAAAGRAVPGPPFAEELPPGVDDLTSPERRAAIAMLRALVSQRQEINRYVDHPASDPATPSGASSEAGEIEEDDARQQSDYDLAGNRDVGQSEGRRLYEESRKRGEGSQVDPHSD